MPVVIGINPSKKKKPKPKGKPRKDRSMAGKKKGKKKGGGGSKPKTKTRTKTVTKWRYRNPPKKKRGGGGGRGRAKRGFAALDVGKALRNSVALMAGMVAAKAAVNKITAGGSETELWSWPNIATCRISWYQRNHHAMKVVKWKPCRDM